MIEKNYLSFVTKLTLKDYLMFVVIGIFVSIIYVTSNFYFDEAGSDLQTFLVSSLGTFAVFVLCVMVAKGQKGFRKVNRLFVLLGIGFLFITLGEVAYWLLDIAGLQTYPSFADILFFMQFVMFGAFYVKIAQIFVSKKKLLKFALPSLIIPITIVSAYLLFTLPQIDNLDTDFWYEIAFISGTSSTLGMTVGVVMITRGGIINKVWVMILFGLMLNSIGDVWYYYLESVGSYDLIHPVNLLWYAAYAIMIYAVYKHNWMFSGVKKNF